MLDTLTQYPKRIQIDNPVVGGLRDTVGLLLQPLRGLRTYDRSHLRADSIAGLTAAVMLLPQALAFALIAELPPEMGLYAAVVGGMVAALWGSSEHLQTGPTNAGSLLVLSVLLTVAAPGTPSFIVAAGLLAVMVGVFQLFMGIARLGVLVNFVSYSVVVGFSSGAGLLIAINQLRHLFGLDLSVQGVLNTLYETALYLPTLHWATTLLGLGTIAVMVGVRWLNPKLPTALISMSLASLIVFALGLDKAGVAVIGQLPSNLPPFSQLPIFDISSIAHLSSGALAVGAIGLVQTTAIARSIAAITGQRLDSNQEFVGQGLANIAAGFFSGYPVSASFSVSAVNHRAGAKTRLAAILAGTFVLVAMLFLAPLAAYLPRAALAGALIVTAYGLINRADIARIWRGARSDAFIMLATFVGTLLLNIEFAVLLGILISFAFYIMKTSAPRIVPVLPDESFKHFTERRLDQKLCPQLGILQISGDLYFGAVNHVEEEIYRHLEKNSEQRFLLLRMHGVNHCDFSGIHMMEAVRHACQDRGGDIYFMKIQEPVLEVMKSTGFYHKLGPEHFLESDKAIPYLFYKIIDPAICIYECDVRAFEECQNLPKRNYPLTVPLHTDIPTQVIPSLTPQALRQKLRNGATPPLVIDVRERREYNRGHIPQAKLIPLPKIISDGADIPCNQEIILVCGRGRRSARAAHFLRSRGCESVTILQGGMIGWEAAGFLEAIEL